MKQLLKRIKPLCFFLILGLMAWGLWKLKDTLREALGSANWWYLGAASMIALIYLVLNASVWGLIVRLFNVSFSRWKVGALWIECESMRWLPGGIWGYASRVVEAKRIGLNKTNGGLSLAVELVLTVLSWALLGLLGTLCSPRLREVFFLYLERCSISPVLMTFVMVGGCVLLVCAWFSNVFSLKDKVMRATSDLRRGLFLNWPLSLRALGEYLCLNVFYSIGFLLCLKGIHVDPLPSLVEAGGAYGLAWIVGFVAFGAPGGMGVREGFLYLVFEPLGIGAEIATAAILWRALQIMTELALLMLVKVTRFAP